MPNETEFESGFDFNNKTTWKMQMGGRKDGEFHYEAGEGFLFNHMDQWRDNRELRIQFPQLRDYL